MNFKHHRKKKKQLGRTKILLASLAGLACGSIGVICYRFNEVGQKEIHVLDGKIKPYFSPPASSKKTGEDNLEARIINTIQKSTTSIHIAMSNFTHPTIYDELLKAKRRGVKLFLILDSKNGKGASKKIKERAIKDFDAVYEGPPGVTFHHKFAVFDKKILLHGSAAWSRNAFSNNRETVLYIEDRYVAQKFLKRWHSYTKDSAFKCCREVTSTS